MDEIEKKEQFVNVVVKNEPMEEDGIAISFVGIFKYLRRFLALWLAVSIIISVIIPIGFVIFEKNEKKTQALVSFTYDGVEKGLDPQGNTFYADTMKNPQVIASALEELGLSAGMLEKVRKAVKIASIIPQDAMERITAYKNIFEAGGGTALTAAELILDRAYYPTQYTITFDYAGTGLGASDAADLLNKILEKYGEYFLKTYGFNEALGNAVRGIDYNDYDYAEAVELLGSTLSMLGNYVDSIGRKDSTRFRSAQTGYTFADLSESISMLRTMDLGMISSYITLNTVTKNKESLVTYYEYMVEDLTRQQNVEQEMLNIIDESIKSYEKNVVMLVGTSSADGENVNMAASGSSEQYDRLFTQKVERKESLSKIEQQVAFYNQKIERLRKSVSMDTPEQREKVETDLAKLNDKVNNLLEMVNVTAEEYYKTVVYANVFNVLVPANTFGVGGMVQAVKHSLKTVIIIDALVFVVYLAIAVVLSCVEEYRKSQGIVTVSDFSNSRKTIEEGVRGDKKEEKISEES